MNVEIVHTGSAGNCVVVDDKIIIDAGWRCDALGLCVLLTHHHTDHTKHLADLNGLPVYCSQGTADALEHKHPFVAFNIVKPNIPFKVGDYVITPFELRHDAPCVGYEIEHDGKRILYATDFNTMVDEERFIKNLKRKTFDAVYIECNNTLSQEDIQELFFYEDKPPKDEFHRRRSYNNHCNVGYLIDLFQRAGYNEEKRFTEPVMLLHKSSFYYGKNPERLVDLCKIANVINPLY